VYPTYAYDDANCMTSVNGMAYTFDANGNLLSDGAYTYDYDPAIFLLRSAVFTVLRVFLIAVWGTGCKKQ
jgi:hypothetical protein